MIAPLYDLDAWTLSRRGNLWTRHGNSVLTLFERQDGTYGWCIADGDGPVFARRKFRDRGEALADLRRAVEKRETHGGRLR
jgi:hypothetical protein